MILRNVNENYVEKSFFFSLFKLLLFYEKAMNIFKEKLWKLLLFNQSKKMSTRYAQFECFETFFQQLKIHLNTLS